MAHGGECGAVTLTAAIGREGGREGDGEGKGEGGKVMDIPYKEQENTLF